MTERAIVTEHIFPPIPDRSNDWVASRDGDDEAGLRGWGPTKDAAVADLQETEREQLAL